ncbi:hypothetical protein Pcinc_025938 [Petrolisthes cinctipes]|uniref:Uncharacterized protein n=1 Tax=Petrolisthes cinctipes TaxID=88211 RepID=A0AAE1F7U4_PETCI|nr:hypothetical protein Pcinc_025938 [Petrolisthes cinctipes]
MSVSRRPECMVTGRLAGWGGHTRASNRGPKLGAHLPPPVPPLVEPMNHLAYLPSWGHTQHGAPRGGGRGTGRDERKMMA